MRRDTIQIVALLAVVLFAACGGSTPDTTGGADDAAVSTRRDTGAADRDAPPSTGVCESDNNCATGEVCRDGRCEETGGAGPGDDASVVPPPADTGNVNPPEDAGGNDTSVDPPVDAGGGDDTAGPADTSVDPPDIAVQDTNVDPPDNPPPPVFSKILPGEGIDIDQGGLQASIRVGQNFGDVSAQIGEGATSPELQNNEFARVYEAQGVSLLFVDKDNNDRLTGPDVVNRVLVRNNSNGKTPGGVGIGAPGTAFAELGPREASDSVTEGQIDYWFTRGTSLTINTGGSIEGFSLYKPQPLVPDAVIDFKGTSLSGSISIRADIEKGDSFSSVEGKLGPPDTTSKSGDVRTRSWVSLGVSVINGRGEDRVNVIGLVRPYQGKLKGTNLGIGATRAEVEQALGRPSKTTRDKTTGQELYLYKVKDVRIAIVTVPIYLAIIYTDRDTVLSYVVGYAEPR